jgi:hypothetical protein
MTARRLVACLVAADVLILVALWVGGGRPEANWHPARRAGFPQGGWY